MTYSEEQLKRDFKRSRWFGVGGVFVLMIVVAALALTFGQDTADPTGLYIVIFVLVFGFVGLMLRFQRRDLDRAEANAKAEASGPVSRVTDPTMATSASLLAALATGPIDREAIEKATESSWEMGRSSISSGAIMVVLIAIGVIPWQLFQFPWALVVVVPIIVFYAFYLLSNVMGRGGSLAPAYALSEPTMKPLGLTLTEAPSVRVSPRPTSPGLQKHVVGTATYEGNRHGRAVRLRLASKTTTEVGGVYPSFQIRNREGRLRPAAGSPPEVETVIAQLNASPLWRGVNVRGGDGGIVVERKDNRASWMCDLWLAERLADAWRRSEAEPIAPPLRRLD